MVSLDETLDNKPTAKDVQELAELRIRNILCLRELQYFNAKGKWLNKHPLLSQYSYRNKLIELKKSNSYEFLKEFAKTQDNVKRYSSYLNKPKAPAEQREKWQNQLDKHQERVQVFTDVMKNE